MKEAVTFTATILRETVTEIGKNKQRVTLTKRMSARADDSDTNFDSDSNGDSASASNRDSASARYSDRESDSDKESDNDGDCW